MLSGYLPFPPTPFIILLLTFGVCHSFLWCLGELPTVNSSVGSNCCTCNCQSTLQAILQELRTMRKLMQIQAGTDPRPLTFNAFDLFSWAVYCALGIWFFSPCCLAVLFQHVFPLANLTGFSLLILLLIHSCARATEVWLTPLTSRGAPFGGCLHVNNPYTRPCPLWGAAWQ